MFALCDANGFYAACEKVFNPSLRNKPVVVLSNNDGCVVAACGITKGLDIDFKFRPYFQIKLALDKAGVVACSSNYELYADLSQKMMVTCGRFAKDYHIYSIDECFLDFADVYAYEKTDQWMAMGSDIRQTVWRETRLPIGVGIGLTATLAKAANHAAKRIEGYRGVAVINDEKSRHHILSRMALIDVWGIGGKLSKRLTAMGYKNAYELSQASPQLIRKQFSILLENTVRELNGEVRLNWDDVRPGKKEIYSTRSFGQRVTTKRELLVSLMGHAEKVSAKLRAQGSKAKSICLFASSSPHDNTPHVNKQTIATLTMPTSDLMVLSNLVTQAVDNLFVDGVQYYKSGIGAINLIDEDKVQQDLFEPSMDDRDLMQCLDGINAKFGNGALKVAARGVNQGSAMKRDRLSPQYTTRWGHIPRVKC